jgi:hypothetical protein
MKVSFDSNAWEAVFTIGDAQYSGIRVALVERRIAGFVCEAGFRIEAIVKRQRSSYFAKPRMRVDFGSPGFKANAGAIFMTMGPDDGAHPGLPAAQKDKLLHALASGIRLMYGQNWMGVPRPFETRDPGLFVPEDEATRSEREWRQIGANEQLEARGVGKAAFDAADGWENRPRTTAEEKRLAKACAEWADGELVGAHIAYGNDVLCTNDRARSAGRSVFDAANRAWLTDRHRVAFLTLDELAARVVAS